MAGEIKRLIDKIIKTRSKGDPTLEYTTKTKLIIKGIQPDKYTLTSDDDPVVINKVKQIGQSLGVAV